MSDTHDDREAWKVARDAWDETLTKTESIQDAWQRVVDRLSAHFQRQAEPVADVIVSNNGSIGREIAPRKWATYQRELDKLKDNSWVKAGRASIRPLYLDPPIPPDMVMVPRDLMNELECGSSNFDRYGVTQRYCPICGEQREDGHAADCDLAKAMIAAANKEGA